MLVDITKAHFLITGGAGFMGSSFIRYLLRQKEFCGRVTNLDCLTYASDVRHIDPFRQDPRYQLVVADINDCAQLDAVHAAQPIDVIVHFAAETHVDRSIADPSAFVQTNVVGTYRLLEWMRRYPEIHLHHISTDEVYGSLSGSGSFSTRSPYRPSSPYAASKAASDHFVRAYAHTFGLSCTLSQACNNYGPHQFPEKFIPLMVLNCLRGQKLSVYGNGSHRREWLFVDDHSHAIATILRCGQRGQIYPVTSGEECSNLTLLDWVIEAVAKETKQPADTYRKLIAFVPDRLGHDFRYSLDREPMTALGWRPHITLKEGIARAVAWYAAHLNWIEKVEAGYRWYHQESRACTPT